MYPLPARLRLGEHTPKQVPTGMNVLVDVWEPSTSGWVNLRSSRPTKALRARNVLVTIFFLLCRAPALCFVVVALFASSPLTLQLCLIFSRFVSVNAIWFLRPSSSSPPSYLCQSSSCAPSCCLPLPRPWAVRAALGVSLWFYLYSGFHFNCPLPLIWLRKVRIWQPSWEPCLRCVHCFW